MDPYILWGWIQQFLPEHLAHLSWSDPGLLARELAAYAWSKLDLTNTMGLIGGLVYVATLWMRTMVPLRVIGIFSNFAFLAYGILARSLPTFMLYAVLLPINCVRLYQMLALIRKVKTATESDLSMDWLKPFMTQRKYKKGDILFKKGEQANEMLYTVSGRYLVSEIGVEILPGRLMGELGLLTPGNRRTQSVECIENGEVLAITYDRVLELYFQDPEFGFYFLRLTTERLMQNVARLEKIVEENKIQMDRMRLTSAGKPG
ncbi:MAG: cyclic nucleotide-binding domain-containing protein [Pseudorhodoplanes sp.]|nr:cyclic nucleotide-binding domain-containing protein [Pseudorhodoplanes sp.]